MYTNAINVWNRTPSIVYAACVYVMMPIWKVCGVKHCVSQHFQHKKLKNIEEQKQKKQKKQFHKIK